MADPRLQWKQLNVAAPNVSGLMSGANDALNNAADAASSILGRYEEGRVKKNDIEVGNEIAALNTQEEIDAYFKNGGLKGRQVSENILNQVTGRNTVAGSLENNQSIMADRSGRLGIANSINNRAQGDWDYGNNRRNELAGLSDEVVAARLEGQQNGTYGQTPSGNPAFLTYDNQNATRNKPISNELIGQMSFLENMGIRMNVVSGGQEAKGTPGAKRVGSERHDHGNAADVDFYMGDRKLDWNNSQDLPVLEEIVGRARANGVTGIGAGDDYMGAGRFHIGGGPTAVWGAGGKDKNAPQWLKTAVANSSQYQNKDGSINVTQATAQVNNPRSGTTSRDVLAAAVAQSQYLSLEDVDSILNGSDAATKRGDDRIAGEVAQQIKDLTAQLTMEAISNPENTTDVAVMKEVTERASGQVSSSELLDLQQAAESIIAGSEGLQSQLAPTVAQDLERDAAVENTVTDAQRRFDSTDQNRAISEISRYAEDPAASLESDLGLPNDPQSLKAYDGNLLRNLVNEYALKLNIEPAVVAVAMRDSFKRDPGDDENSSFWYDMDLTPNTLRNRFVFADVEEAAKKLNPNARQNYERGQSNLDIMNQQMKQVRGQQDLLRQKISKLPEGDPRRTIWEAQMVALDAHLAAIEQARR